MSDQPVYQTKVSSDALNVLAATQSERLIRKIQRVVEAYAKGDNKPKEILNFPSPNWFYHDDPEFLLVFTINADKNVLVLDMACIK